MPDTDPVPDLPTVLAVDDDPAILRIIESILQPAGYRVLLATGGWHALETFEKADPPVRLLLTDVVMPDLTGPVLAAKLRASNPQLPVLFISGFHDTGLLHRFRTDRRIVMLSKPFTKEGLLRAVDDSLHRS